MVAPGGLISTLSMARIIALPMATPTTLPPMPISAPSIVKISRMSRAWKPMDLRIAMSRVFSSTTVEITL